MMIGLKEDKWIGVVVGTDKWINVVVGKVQLSRVVVRETQIEEGCGEIKINGGGLC